MSTAHDLLDPYSLRARLQPALIAFAPILIAVFAIAPAAWEPIRSGLALATTVGGALLLSHIVRDLGKNLEVDLYAMWGGKPSMAMLRHRDRRLQPELKRRYHQRLSAALGQPMPNADEEATDPASADEIYDAASAWLLSRSRDGPENRLLFAENISYGFRRNLLASRTIALVTAAGSAAAIVPTLMWGVPLSAPDDFQTKTAALIGLGGIVLYAAIIGIVVTRDWVRLAAEAYATRLLEVIDRQAVRPPATADAHGPAASDSVR